MPFSHILLHVTWTNINGITVYFTAAAFNCVLHLHRHLISAVGIYDIVPSPAV